MKNRKGLSHFFQSRPGMGCHLLNKIINFLTVASAWPGLACLAWPGWLGWAGLAGQPGASQTLDFLLK